MDEPGPDRAPGAPRRLRLHAHAARWHARAEASPDGARILATRLLPAFGPDLPVRQLTAPAIAQYERPRMAEVSAYTVALELAVLRHMLRLGRRWGYLDEVPEIEMPKKPEGRQRYLDEGEITRLLDACRASWPAPRDHRDDRD